MGVVYVCILGHARQTRQDKASGFVSQTIEKGCSLVLKKKCIYICAIIFMITVVTRMLFHFFQVTEDKVSGSELLDSHWCTLVRYVFVKHSFNSESMFQSNKNNIILLHLMGDKRPSHSGAHCFNLFLFHPGFGGHKHISVLCEVFFSDFCTLSSLFSASLFQWKSMYSLLQCFSCKLVHITFVNVKILTLKEYLSTNAPALIAKEINLRVRPPGARLTKT